MDVEDRAVAVGVPARLDRARAGVLLRAGRRAGLGVDHPRRCARHHPLVLVSLAFKLYVANFGNYNATYGAMGGVIVLLLWFYLRASPSSSARS